MEINKITDTCYVFSQATLEQALQEWVKEKTNSDAENSENYLIVVAAMPWFLKHLNQSASIFMFSQNDLLDGMKKWKDSQQQHYPHQNKRIEFTCSEIINFFQSDVVNNHKMIVQA